jgi:hypothetical protein
MHVILQTGKFLRLLDCFQYQTKNQSHRHKNVTQQTGMEPVEEPAKILLVA